MLSQIHDGSLWLENGPIKITKRIINRVTSYPTLDQPKTLRSDSKEVIEKNIGEKWNKRGMKIDTITDPLLDFVVRVISHKFYQSSRLNSVPYIAMDVGYKIVKKDHTYDLAELQLQLMEPWSNQENQECTMQVWFNIGLYILLCTKHVPLIWNFRMEDQHISCGVDQ